MSSLWIIWLTLGAIFIAAELFTSGFVLLWFGVGAIVAALLALTGIVGLPLQIIIFFAVSIALTIASRTIFERFFIASSPERELKTGIDSLPGRVGVVVEPSAGESGEGAVKVFGSVWRAFPAEGEDLLRAGEQVQVERVDGVSVFVRRAGRGPSWRDAGRDTGREQGRLGP